MGLYKSIIQVRDIMKKHLGRIFGNEICMILGMNRVAMARNGLKLWENGAGRSRKAMGHLPEPWDSIKKSKTAKSLKTTSPVRDNRGCTFNRGP